MKRDLNDIAVFDAVVTARSFTAAGRRLGLPRSTVSRRVAHLEQRLGTTLLRRTTRRLELTEAGATYHAQCARGLAEIDGAEQQLAGSLQPPQGGLRLCVTPQLGAGYLAPRLASFAHRFATVRVRVVVTERNVDLEAEGFDAALDTTASRNSRLTSRRVSTLYRRLYASDQYLRARGEPGTVTELGEHDCVTAANHDAPQRWLLMSEHDEQQVQVRGGVSCRDEAFAAKAAVAGAGIALLLESCCANELGAGLLKQVLPAYRSEPLGVYLTRPATRPPGAALHALGELLQQSGAGHGTAAARRDR